MWKYYKKKALESMTHIIESYGERLLLYYYFNPWGWYKQFKLDPHMFYIILINKKLWCSCLTQTGSERGWRATKELITEWTSSMKDETIQIKHKILEELRRRTSWINPAAAYDNFNYTPFVWDREENFRGKETITERYEEMMKFKTKWENKLKQSKKNKLLKNKKKKKKHLVQKEKEKIIIIKIN